MIQLAEVDRRTWLRAARRGLLATLAAQVVVTIAALLAWPMPGAGGPPVQVTLIVVLGAVTAVAGLIGGALFGVMFVRWRPAAGGTAGCDDNAPAARVSWRNRKPTRIEVRLSLGFNLGFCAAIGPAVAFALAIAAARSSNAAILGPALAGAAALLLAWPLGTFAQRLLDPLRPAPPLARAATATHATVAVNDA